MPNIDSFADDLLESLPTAFAEAVQAAELPGLGEGPHDEPLARLLAEGDSPALFHDLSATRRAAGLSGLWLLAGELERSHEISQGIDDAAGSFWHGIMHRREGDYGNAKYWFRRVGNHPVLDQLSELPDGYDDPFGFVDACSRAGGSGDADYQACVRKQWVEWQALMTHCVCG